jgi:DNA-binding transcriptional LysR family regulator
VFSWSDLRYLLAVHRAGSLLGAARELRVAQSTVGRRLQALETSLRARLLDRGTEGLALSDAGRALLPIAERMEQDALEAEARVASLGIEARGRVRLATPDVLGSLFIVPRLPALLDKHPQLQVELLADNRLADLGRREADLAVRLHPPRGAHLTVRRLGAIRYGLYASPAYLRASAPLSTSLVGHTIVASSEPFAATPDQLWLRSVASGARLGLCTSSVLAELEAAKCGLGIAALPVWLGATHVPALERVLPGAHTDRNAWLLMRRDLKRSTAVRTVADFLIALFRAPLALR